MTKESCEQVWSKTAIEKSIELFKMDIWDRLGQPNIDNFGGKCIDEFSLDSLKILMIKFK
jgi:hypothetical protein